MKIACFFARDKSLQMPVLRILGSVIKSLRELQFEKRVVWFFCHIFSYTYCMGRRWGKD